MSPHLSQSSWDRKSRRQPVRSNGRRISECIAIIGCSSTTHKFPCWAAGIFVDLQRFYFVNGPILYACLCVGVNDVQHMSGYTQDTPVFLLCASMCECYRKTVTNACPPPLFRKLISSRSEQEVSGCFSEMLQ